MKTLQILSSTGFALFTLNAAAATFSTPYRDASKPSKCTDDTLITMNAADERDSWAFRCEHLDRAAWQPVFTAAQNKRSYPIFVNGNGNRQVHRPDYASCVLPSDVVFFEVCENGKTLFDGAAKKYGAGQTWDTAASNVNAWENGKVIRYQLNNENFWGAAAYVFNPNYSYVDLSQFSKLHLQIKNSGYGASLGIQVFLVDMDGHAESVRLPAVIDRSWQDIVINLDQLELNGFPLARTQALVIGVSEDKTQSYLLDIAKISVD